MPKTNDIEDYSKSDKEKLRDRIRAIKKSVYAKGRFVYYDMKLKEVARGNGATLARSRLRKYIKEDPENRLEKYYVLTKLTTFDTYRMIFDMEPGGGGIHIWAGLEYAACTKRKTVTIKLQLKRKDKKGVKAESTTLWINYRPLDIRKFKINDPARVAKSLIKAEYEPCNMRPVGYTSMKWAKK